MDKSHLAVRQQGGKGEVLSRPNHSRYRLHDDSDDAASIYAGNALPAHLSSNAFIGDARRWQGWGFCVF
jgi:hypothetical protein